MTLQEARERVQLVAAQVGDPEGVHSEEDRLRADVLRYLAEVAPAELGELARIALSTDEIKSPRWYA